MCFLCPILVNIHFRKGTRRKNIDQSNFVRDFYHVYSVSFSLTNVSTFFWSWILNTVSKFRKRKRKSRPYTCLLFTPYSRAVTAEGRNVQKAWCTCKVVVKPITYLRPQRVFPNMVLKKVNIHEDWAQVTRFNPLWTSDMRKRENVYKKTFSTTNHTVQIVTWLRARIDRGELTSALANSIRQSNILSESISTEGSEKEDVFPCAEELMKGWAKSCGMV